jgi:hypothetical protein
MHALFYKRMSLETLRQNFALAKKGNKGLKSGAKNWMIKMKIN